MRGWNRWILTLAWLLTMAAGSGMAASSALPMLEASGVRGGVVVHLGCGDGRITADLQAGEAFLVHGLDTDAAKVEAARRHIVSLGLYGRVSAETWDGTNLPYGDNIVNLIVIDDPAQVKAAEIARVLSPRGVALIRTDSKRLEGSALQESGAIDGWYKFVKPWPDTIDEWTHFLYDASGNAVSRDKEVRAPHHLQWYAGPRRTRDHDALASLSAMTSSNGRVFYIFDEGATSLIHRAPNWKLIARDAFNGKLLWKRDLPDWMTHLYNFRAGPTQLPRRLVSVGDNVFVTLGFTAPAMKLDAATGKTLHVYAGSENTEELLCFNGLLLTVVGDPKVLIDKSDGCYGYWDLAEHEDPTVDKSIVAYNAETGAKVWTVTGQNLRHLVPMSLCALRGSVFYLDNKQLHRLDAKDGTERWASPFETEGLFIRNYVPTVVAHDDVIMCLKWNRFCGYSIESGKQLWENKGAMGFGSPADLFAIGNKAWTVPMTKSIWMDSKTNKDGIITTGIDIPKTDFLNEAKTAVGLDLHTGAVTDLLPFAHPQHHHRCYRNKATEQYLLLGHSGIQVVDLASQKIENTSWVRGLCQYGIMPANGYLYVPPHPCQCYSSGLINGFFALSETNSWEHLEVVPALEKGPAFAQVAKSAGRTTDGRSDWPTYRGDPARSAAARCEVPAKPAVKWSAEVGRTITAPVIAGGKVFVADRDAYTVRCFDALDGKAVWTFLANGPVDSPPTIEQGICVFGCGDGSVYALDAENGQLAWRFKTSKLERRVGHDDRLESPLRIHGSTLVQDGAVYFAAGYSSNLDGGIRLYGLDLRTGEQRCTARLASGFWGNDGSCGFQSDILDSDGQTIGMRSLAFDGQLKQAKGQGLLVATTGLLEDSWFHRLGWTGGGGKGQLIAFDGTRSVSVMSPYTDLKKERSGKYQEFNQVGHLHQKYTRYQESFFPVGATIVAKGKGKDTKTAGWSHDVKLQPRAMVLAGDRVCLAGWIDAVAIEMKTGRPKNPANPDPRDSVLQVCAAGKYEVESELKLEAEPVFDGLAAANGRLFLSLKNGKLLCLGE